MRKQYYLIALLICLILLVSACKSSGSSSGSAPRTPFIGGTAGISVNFEKDSPPPEVTDDASFAFNAIVRLKNEGEAKVSYNNIKLNLVGFDPSDFGQGFDQLKDATTDGSQDLDSKKRDAEGNILEGSTAFVTFPKNNDNFIPSKFPGNTEFTFRADVCYNYMTEANAKLCILRDMINVRDDSICKPTGLGTTGRVVYSSSAPVQVTNFKQSVIGKDSISFSFDIVLSGNVDIFWNKEKSMPTTSFDNGCPRDPKVRRERENTVGLEITQITSNPPILSDVKCGGLDAGTSGVVRLVNGKRTITCTATLATDRLDLEKTVSIKLAYNVLDNKETKVLVKHLATT